MKRLIFAFTITLSGLLFTGEAFAQESLRDRLARKQNQQTNESLPELTIRAERMNDLQTKEVGNAPWMREIYRYLDLDKEKNAPLYYPVTPMGDRMNLFTMIFKLLANEEIEAYDFLIDGTEIFTDQYKLSFKDLLDRFGIMYVEDNGQFIVDDSDIPSNEVLGYYLKEAWYFDKSNSVVDVKTIAICPVLLRQDDFDFESSRNPLFWVPYESIRPYASQISIMTSNLNNASNQTVDDFFVKRSFDGEIYKTTNMKNLTLAQAFPEETERELEQKKIESQLAQFNNNLWIMNDTTSQTQAVATTKATKQSKSSSSNNNEKVRTNQPKESKSSSSSAPARTMRNRRR